VIKSLSSCDVSINVSAPESVLERILSSNAVYEVLPSPSIGEEVKDSPLIEITESDEFEVIEDYPHYYYKGKSASDVMLIAMLMLERLREEKGEYSIHSSSVEKDGKAVILFGWKDSGKTTTALNLCNNFYFKFLSEGRTVVDRDLKIVGRMLGVDNDHHSLKGKYINRTKRLLDEDKYSPLDKESKLALMVYVQLSPYNEVIRWEPLKAKFHLYELFTHDIRGQGSLINNYSKPLKPVDTEELADARAKFVDKLTLNVPVYQIRGTPDFISEKIAEILQESDKYQLAASLSSF